jgi:predicted exporter
MAGRLDGKIAIVTGALPILILSLFVVVLLGGRHKGEPYTALLPELERKLTDEAIREQVHENKQTLLSPISPVAKQMVRLDPLGFRQLFLSLVENRGGNLRLQFRDGYLFSRDLRLLLMIAKPREPAQNVVFTRALMAEMQGLAGQARSEVAAEGEDLGSVEIGFTGGYAFVVENESILKKDILITLVTASIGIFVLFFLAFRNVATVFYVGLPLLAGLSWTGGFAALTVGNINLFTAASATVLIGLEVDFAIHLLNRYREERARGLEVEESLVETLRNTGVGVLTAAVRLASEGPPQRTHSRSSPRPRSSSRVRSKSSRAVDEVVIGGR